MNLLSILEKNGITTTDKFATDVERREKMFDRWSLILLCSIEDELEVVMSAIKDIVKVDTKQAQAMALLARFKGQAVLTTGEEKTIFEYVRQFDKRGLTAIAVDMFK